jgi:hypothetical protein
LSSPACEDAWRRFTTKQFCGNESALGISVTRLSSSARIVIVGIVIAAPSAASLHAGVSGDAPMGGISAAQKGGSIIATGSASTANENKSSLA